MKHYFFNFIAFFISTFLGFSQTSYVSPQGDDISGDGTITSPFKTIQKAAASSTEVLLVEGVYQDEQILNSINNVTIKPAPGANIVFNGKIGYTNYKKISALVEPRTMIDLETILSFSNTYFVGYNYINYNYGDLGESSDKYRITDQYINTLYFGISFDL